MVRKKNNDKSRAGAETFSSKFQELDEPTPLFFFLTAEGESCWVTGGWKREIKSNDFDFFSYTFRAKCLLHYICA